VTGQTEHFKGWKNCGKRKTKCLWELLENLEPNAGGAVSFPNYRESATSPDSVKTVDTPNVGRHKFGDETLYFPATNRPKFQKP
jgi:hypothetical protein